MSSLNVKVDGEWKSTKKTYLKLNGAWVESKKIYIKKDGVWTEFNHQTQSTMEEKI